MARSKRLAEKAQKKQKPAQQDDSKSEVQQPKKQKKVQKKQKKTRQPKKYQKTYEEIARINRSKFQRIYLLSAKRNQQLSWNFQVQGTSGSTYHVSVSTSVSCTCVDYRFKKKPCKHIYFIVTQVAQNDEILDYFKNDTKITKTVYKILDGQLASRLKSRMQKPSQDGKQIDLKDDTDCTICFTQMDKTTQNLQDCGTCKKYFHFECLVAWKQRNPTCPLCRGALKGAINLLDPLGKLTQVKLSQQ